MGCLGSDDVVRDVIIELCFLCDPYRAYMGSRGLFKVIRQSVVGWRSEQ
jgi:hypothetical protein